MVWNKGKKGIYSKDTIEKMNEGRTKAWSNPELRIRQSELTKIGMNNSEVRRKISQSKKGKQTWMKGKRHSPESLLKLKISLRRAMDNPETRKKMSESSKNKWNDPEYRKRMSEVHKGKSSPNKGKVASLETRIKLRESHKGQTPWIKGKSHSEATKKRLSETSLRAWSNSMIKKKLLEANRERYLNPESLEKIKNFSRSTILRLYESGSFPKQTNTLPERKMKEELLKRGYKEGEDFIHQYRFMEKFMCDFCFPKQKVIVEVYGDFWHAHPIKYPEGGKLHPHQLKVKGRDKSKEAYITKVDNGVWTYIFVWESDIKKNVVECVNKIEKVLLEKKLI